MLPKRMAVASRFDRHDRAFPQSAQRPGCRAWALRFSPSHYRVFGRLHRSGSDDLASWLRLKDGWLFCEWIDAPARLRGGLLYDNELGESWHHERAGLLEFPVANFGHRLDDALDVLARDLVWMPLDEVR